MSKKDSRQLEKKLIESGFTVRLTSRGHLLVKRGNTLITCFAGTPSDSRSWKNSLAPLRRVGFTL